MAAARRRNDPLVADPHRSPCASSRHHLPHASLPVPDTRSPELSETFMRVLITELRVIGARK
jgi:hypothetical protein